MGKIIKILPNDHYSQEMTYEEFLSELENDPSLFSYENSGQYGPINNIEYQLEEGDTHETIAEDIFYLFSYFRDLDNYKNTDEFAQYVNGLKSFITEPYFSNFKNENKTLEIPGDLDFIICIDTIRTYYDIHGDGTVEKSEESSNSTNNITIIDSDINIAIKIFNNYESYEWKNDFDPSKFSDGRTNIIAGNCQDAELLENGYLYIYKNNELAQIYEVNNNEYQEIRFSQNHVDYNSYSGQKRNYMIIRNYDETAYNSRGEELEDSYGDDNTGNEFYIIVSKIPLSDVRLFGIDAEELKINPRLRGRKIYKTIETMNRIIDEDNRSVEQIHEDYKNRGSNTLPDEEIYYIKKADFDGTEGFYIFFPDTLSETNKSKEYLQEKLDDYEEWINDDEQVKKGYIYETVKGIINSSSDLRRRIDVSKHSNWKLQYDNEYREKKDQLKSAAKYFSKWFESNITNDIFLDYLCGSDDEQLEIFDFYVEKLKGLIKLPTLSKFLLNRYKEKHSFISIALATFRPDMYENDDIVKNHLLIRKINETFFDLFFLMLPVIIVENPNHVLIKIAAFLENLTGISFNYQTDTVRQQPITNMNTEVNIFDVANILRKLSTSHQESHIPFEVILENRISIEINGYARVILEGFNLYNSIYNLANSDEDEKSINILNLVSATCDMTTGVSWLVTQTTKFVETNNRYVSFLLSSTGYKTIAAFDFISASIDFIIGLIGLVEAIHNEENAGVIFGWAAFTLGAGLIAVVSFLKIIGVITSASGVGGVLILIGFAIEAIGLIFINIFENRDLKLWLENCTFGRSPSTENLEIQINRINSILCDFKVKAKFDNYTDTTYRTEVKLIIEPQMIIDYSILYFTNIHLIGQNNLTENIFGNDTEKEEFNIMHPPFQIQLDEPPEYCEIIRKDQRIEKIKIIIDEYDNKDIDKIEGNIRLLVAPGSMQETSKNFSEDNSLIDGV